MRRLIEDGLLKRTIIKYEEYEMRFLDKSNIDQMIELQDEVVKNLNDAETFVKDSRDFISDILNDEMGRAIGVFADNRLIAFRTISFPGSSEANMGRELNIPEEELDRVVHLEATMVHPEYRGNRLQAKMMKHTFRIIDALGYFYVCTTVSPFNYPSLKNVMDAGLTIRTLSQRGGQYENKWRFLLFVDTRYSAAKKFRDHIEVKNGRLARQQELLNQGYIGFALTRLNYPSDEFIIHYGLPM